MNRRQQKVEFLDMKKSVKIFKKLNRQVKQQIRHTEREKKLLN